MNIRLVFCILLLVFTTVLFMSFSHSNPLVKMEAVEAVNLYYQHLNDGESEKAIQMLSSQFTGFLPNGDALVYFEDREAKTNLSNQYTLVDFDVRIVGNTAIVTNTLITEDNKSKQFSSFHSTLTTILEKQNGYWKILHQHYT